MYKIDSSLTAPLIAIYIALMGIVLINLFIALISASLSRIYDKAEAFMTFQRASEILKVERSMENKIPLNPFSKLLKHFCWTKILVLGGKTYNDFYRLKKYNPYENQKSNDTSDDRMSNIENQMVEQVNLLVNIISNSVTIKVS